MEEKSHSKGKTVKIVFEDEVRKYRNINSYKDLILAIARTLGYGVLNCRFVYTDDDNDEITVSNEEDLQEAFNFFDPKPPRLELITYNEKVDLSLSNVKLCDSMLSGDERDEVDEEEPSENDIHFTTITNNILPSQIDLPLQMETEDRPRQMIAESTCERDVQPDQTEEQKVEVSEVSYLNIEFLPNSDEKESEQVDPPVEAHIQEHAEEEPDEEIIEDRIQPAIVKEEKVEQPPAPESPIKDREEFKVVENKPEPTNLNILDSEELKAKVAELVKQELSLLLPKLLEESKAGTEERKISREKALFADSVHKGFRCDG